MLRWTNPNPPARAMAIAMSDSVTVSIAALTIGRFSVTLRLTRQLRSVSLGMKSAKPGITSTSSKVRPKGSWFSSMAVTPIQSCWAAWS
ncbi:hypothetical protein D3C72_739720 [compost metagenome]